MPRSWTDEALVLRTYNVGEADRFCILLTRDHGRVAARATGVRRLLSRSGSGLLPLHRVSVTCEAHSFGMVIASVTCIDPHAESWRDPYTFSCAQQGIELLLRLIEDGEPLPEVYRLTRTFLAACTRPYAQDLPSVFAIKLLQLLGSCPSFTHSSVSHRPLAACDQVVYSLRSGGLATVAEDAGGMRLSPAFSEWLRSMDALSFQQPLQLSTSLSGDLTRFVHCLLGSQLGSSVLVAPGVSVSISAGVTPTCQVSGRVS